MVQGFEVRKTSGLVQYSLWHNGTLQKVLACSSLPPKLTERVRVEWLAAATDSPDPRRMTRASFPDRRSGLDESRI
ncbi:hypothetical protein GCM10027449_01150 [Sinomonas notoginsengisoli]